MAGNGDYLAILSITLFLFCTWLATKVSRVAGVSSVMLEIAVGIVLGPSVWGHITPAWSECQARRHVNCQAPSDVVGRVLAGESLGHDLDMILAGPSCDRHRFEPWLSHSEGYFAAAAYRVQAHTQQEGYFVENMTDGEDTQAEEPEAESEEEPEGESEDESEERRRLSTILYKSDEGDKGTAVKVLPFVSIDTLEECLVKHCERQVAHKCQLTPSFLTLIGHVGVMLLFFESGMHFDLAKARDVGPRACAVAALGFILPLAGGMLVTICYGKPLVPDGVYVGTALVPTSIGFALRCLGDANVLQEDFGQAIVTAAFGSDLLSLILFCVMFNWRTEFYFVNVIILPIVGIVITLLAMFAAVKFWPRFINDVILARIPEQPNQKVSQKDQALFFIMMVVAVGYATVFHFLGIHLWGCFVAGVSFACIDDHHHMHNVWVKQTKRVTSWLIRIFFAASVGFAIPVSTFLSWESFWKGSIMGIGPCILTKVFCAFFMGEAKFVIGWAMVGRAEFAYFIAQMALSANMMDNDTFSITIWALLYATVFAPVIFRKVLDGYVKTYCPEALAQPEKEEQEPQNAAVAVTVKEPDNAH